MNYDWNWFFSSFCQCAAALIGIIGAFVISRLLGLSEKINTTISELINFTIQYKKLKDSISKRLFHWHTKTYLSYDQKLMNSIINREFERLTESEVLKKIYDLKRPIYKVDAAVKEAYKTLLVDFGPQNSHNHEKMLKKSEITHDIWVELKDEKDKISQLEIESKSLIQQFSHNLNEIESFSKSIYPLRNIIIMLIVAFPLTVIYPLHFMPMNGKQGPDLIYNLSVIVKTFPSLKNWMLVIFFIVMNIIFGYFIYLTFQLKSKLSEAIKNNSKEFKNIKNYSEYFGE